MLGILRKDAPTFAIAVLIVLPLVLVIERLAGPGLGVVFVALNLSFAWLFTFGPLIIVEQDEERSNGYVLLGALPLRSFEVAAAKFLLFLAAMATVTAAEFALLAGIGGDARILRIASTAVLVNSAVCLLAGGIAYAGIFRFGFTRFFTASAVVMLTLTLVPSVLLTAAGSGLRRFIDQILHFLLSVSPWTIIPAGLVFYALLFLLSLSLRAGGVRHINGKELP